MQNTKILLIACLMFIFGIFIGTFFPQYFHFSHIQSGDVGISQTPQMENNNVVTQQVIFQDEEESFSGGISYDYNYVSKHQCNPGIFEFSDIYFLKYFIGASFNDVLMLKSKEKNSFKCIRLTSGISGGKFVLLDDFGEQIDTGELQVNNEGKVVIPEFGADVKKFNKVRHFISLEDDIGGTFEGFFFSKQVKTSKISSLGIALFRQNNQLKGYEFSDDEKLEETTDSKKFADCVTTDKTIQQFLDAKDTFSQGVFKDVADINLSGTVFGTPRFYNSYINYIYKNNIFSSISKLSNSCFSFYK